MREVQLDKRGWHSVPGEITSQVLSDLRELGRIDHLSIARASRVGAIAARGLRASTRVDWLWLWCRASRIALSQIVQIPELRVLDVAIVTPPGKLRGFRSARSLEQFRANRSLEEDDLMEISRCESLRELGAQGSQLTPKALDALLQMPRLETLDLEGSPFDDSMARRIARSQSLASLHIGATRVSRRGLAFLMEMKRLRSLDLWATDVTEDDLGLLRELPRLEYLSVGRSEGNEPLDGRRVLECLMSLPSLKRVWLDGVSVTAEEASALREKLENVRIT